MNRLNNILVTTTNSLEGLKIKKYFRPLSAHVVEGINFFSDFIASFSDVFGGRSGTYQQHLSSIYIEAIEILKQSAFEIGANALIGLRVDLDEISGKGKSMFMITATGTAVLVENLDFEPKTHEAEKLSIISVGKMEEFRRRKEIICLAKENKLIVKRDINGDLIFINEIDKIWDFITTNSVYEIANEILDISLFSATYPKLLSYLFSLEADFTAKLLFNRLMNEEDDSKIKHLYELIKDLRIFDSETIIAYLQSDNELHKRRALRLAVTDKQSYVKEDIDVFDNMIQVIKTSFQEIVSYSTKKGLLSKEKEVWICTCGTKNSIELDYCSKYECNKDKFGFLKSEINPSNAIKKLQENIEIINEYIFQ